MLLTESRVTWNVPRTGCFFESPSDIRYINTGRRNNVNELSFLASEVYRKTKWKGKNPYFKLCDKILSFLTQLKIVLSLIM